MVAILFLPILYIKPVLLSFYHTIIHRYIPIKKGIINGANGIKSKLFKGSNNVLGILERGTDYITKKPRWHPIPPTVEMIINFVLVTILNHISELGTLFTLFDNLTFNHIILFVKRYSLYYVSQLPNIWI